MKRQCRRGVSAILLGSSEVTLVLMDSTTNTPSWLDYVNALSTFAVALFAIVQVVKSFVDDRTRRRANDAKLSAGAYALRRQLEEWTEPLPTDEDSWADRADLIQPNVRRAEKRAAKLVAIAAGCSPAPADAAREAYVLFYRAMSEINGLRHVHHNYVDLSDYDFEKGFQVVRRCCDRLTGAIERDLEGIHDRLASTPESQLPDLSGAN